MTRWIPRKSFDEAMMKAEKLKNAAEARERRNSVLFTDAQENFRRELGLHDLKVTSKNVSHECPYCKGSQVRIKPSRSKTRVRITRR